MAGTKQKKSAEGPMLQIKYIRSAIGTPPKHKLIIKSLGFKRLNQVVIRVDTPQVRGMVAHVPHLVAIVDSE